MQKSRTCPICKAEWTGKDFVGERAAVDMKAKARERVSAGESGPSRRESGAVDDDGSPAVEEVEGG